MFGLSRKAFTGHFENVLELAGDMKRARGQACWSAMVVRCSLFSLSPLQIPYGRKYDKSWLLGMIQSKCSVPFTPIEVNSGVSGWPGPRGGGGTSWARGSGLHA